MFRFLIALLVTAILWTPLMASASGCGASPKETHAAHCLGSVSDDAPGGACTTEDDEPRQHGHCQSAGCVLAVAPPSAVTGPLSPLLSQTWIASIGDRLPFSANLQPFRPPVV